MSENNKSYRIRTEVGQDKSLYFKLDQKFDILEILSLKLRQEGLYKLHTSDYGVIVGRVLANNGFGIPNAKVSVFIQISDEDIRRNEILGLYSFNTTRDKDADGIRYNLLPDTSVNECHKAVGTFPSKTMVLDNDIVLEVFDKYFKFTTKTNESGDYMLFGVPTGNQTVHVDLDLSDIGLLSQRPRDFVYKGYTIEQFENPNQFKGDGDLNGLSQIFSQDSMVEVIPFWGDNNEGLVGISRNDMNIQFKFEPTCVFMGSVVSDNSSNGFSKKCVPTNAMGNMDELVTGNGTIEMIRKKPDGSVEEFQIQGNQLINGNGVWCYQIPMNLDYMKTDEYGNMVPTDNPEEGIPTRARVRFRVSMQDFEENVSNYFRAKVLVPHNPQDNGELDYAFGSGTLDSSYRDIFWNNVYTVKSYIPRIQKGRGIRTERFSGIKHCNIHGQNNPIPYNNIRIRLPFMFTVICAIIKAYIWVITMLNKFLSAIPGLGAWGKKDRDCVYIGDSLCPDLEGWYFAPGCSTKQRSAMVIDFSYAFSTGTYAGKGWWDKIKAFFSFGQWIKILKYTMLQNTYNQIVHDNGETSAYEEDESYQTQDSKSIDVSNRDKNENSVCLTNYIDYLIQCIEINLAQEYKVIQFDFYNDWINGLIYIPRWMRFVRKKRKYLFGLIKTEADVKGCMTNTKVFAKDRYLVDQCSLSYSYVNGSGYTQLSSTQKAGCHKSKQKCHKKHGRNMIKIFGNKGGLVNETKTLQNQNVYYFKPCDWDGTTKVNFFATDLCLLGSLNDCDLYGIPQAFKTLNSSSYQLPTNLALTNMEEDGYMYAQNDNGTICSPNEGYNSQEKVVLADNSFSGAKAYDSSVYTYSGNDDAVPLTESAGIDWGYTGPGQGDRKFDSSTIYQPGGHFMGLSCSQAETNIKTCINLGRICEHGVGMSQRVLIPNTYDEGTDTWNYTNVMPNGFISQDEIFDHDFRTMFATMNYNNLKTKRDEKTGYLKYDFVPSMPTNFDGVFKKYADKYTNQYNSSSNKIKVDLTNVNTTSDNETNDANNAKVRSLEYTNVDYYRFRFGIETTSSTNDKKYFLIKSGSNVSMPVYRNSFYFYFGLSDGATALDEFRKQFFSTCKNTQEGVNTLSLSSASFKIPGKSKDEYTISDFTGNKVVAVVKINGGQMPYKVEIIDSRGNIQTEDNLNTKSIEIPIKTTALGNYRIRVTDIEENTIVRDYDFTIGSIFSLNLSSYDYYVHKNRVNSSDRSTNCDVYGGYILWDGELQMLGKTINSGFTVSASSMTRGTTSDGNIAFYPTPEKGGNYTISLTVGSKFDYKTFTINEVDDLNYWVGHELLNYENVLKGKALNGWYSSLTNEQKWIYRHFFTRQDRTSGLNINTKIIGRTSALVSDVTGTPERIIGEDQLTGEYEIEVSPTHKTKSALGNMPETYSGYDLSFNGIYAPTTVIVDGSETQNKQEFQFIVYDTKGQIGVGTQITNNNKNLKVTESGNITGISGLRTGYRYLITNKNVSFLGYATGGDAGTYSSSSLRIDEMEKEDLFENKDLIEGVPTQVYGFHSFPVYYKPFYFKEYVWSGANSGLRANSTKGKAFIYNGITNNKKFSSVISNGSNITNSVSITASDSNTSDISVRDRVTEISSNTLGINSTAYSNGNITFSCTEGKGSEKVTTENLVTREGSLTFLFKEDIKVVKDENTGLLKVNAIGESEGVSYFAINANASSVDGKRNDIGFPITNSSNATWEWNDSCSLLNPNKALNDGNYKIGDWLSTRGLDTLDSYFTTGITDDVPAELKGSYVENISNKVGNGTTLTLRFAEKLSDVYILGVADIEQMDGSSICAYYVYDKFQKTSLFHGTYTFGDPEFNSKNSTITFVVTISGKETWDRIREDGVTIKAVINGSVSYTEIDVNNNPERKQVMLENIELTKKSQLPNFDGGSITYTYQGEHTEYKSFTMKGVTTLKISGTAQSGTDESGNPITTTIEEQFSSKDTWVVNGAQDLKPNEYMWEIKATGQDDDGKLKIEIVANPYYNEMKGSPADILNFRFYVNDDKENPLTLTLNMTRSTSKTYSNVVYNDITSISGEIISNPSNRMYNYDNKVTLI